MRRNFSLALSCCLLWGLSALSSAQGPPETPAPAAASPAAGTTVPRLVSFSAVAMDGLGKPVTGQRPITFSLYAEQEGGNPLWSETQLVQMDAQGRYAVFLGSTEPTGLPLDLFTRGQARWLAVSPVSGSPDPPRVLLVGVPYALKAADADTLGGKPASAYATIEPQDSAAAATNGSGTSQTSRQAAGSGSANGVTAALAGTGKTDFIPLWTNSTTLGDSALFQIGGNIGLSTITPTQKFEVDSGNLLVRGLQNFGAGGNTAFLYVGDTSHPIEALYNKGLAIGTYKVPEAVFIADITGKVGIGTTTPTAGILNTMANSKSVVGISAVGWNAPSGSGLSGTNGIHVTGGSGDPDSGSGGAGVIGAGGSGGNGGAAGAVFTGGVGVNASGPGVIARGGDASFDFGAGDGVDATGGNFGGIGVVATAGFGADGPGGPPGVLATGGIGDNGGVATVTNGPGITAAGGGGGGNSGGDGIDAIAGTGCGSGCTNGLAGSFTGEVSVTGNLTVSGTKHFKIDHPLDPANKYLYHASIESSEVLNLYSGNVTLGSSGEATVQLPDWFEALNKDFRYQLTAIGAAAPNLHIAKELENHSFAIAGGVAGMKVSWQVSAVRQDAWEKAHPMIVEAAKPQNEKGYYLNPELFGAPPEKGIQWARYPALMERMRQEEMKAAERAKQAQAKQARAIQ